MPIGFQSIGGSTGRPTGQQNRACMTVNGTSLFQPCTPQILNRNVTVMSNNNYHLRGDVNSTTGGSHTGGSLGAVKRRT
jgi:hypothetical protein